MPVGTWVMKEVILCLHTSFVGNLVPGDEFDR